MSCLFSPNRLQTKTKKKKKMITKEQFCELIQYLQNQREVDENFSAGMRLAFPSSYTPITENGNLWQCAMKAISMLIEDKDEWLDWWLWECGSGDKKVYFKDIEYILETPEQLYEFIAMVKTEEI